MSSTKRGPPGTGFLDAETGLLKSPPETTDARRDVAGDGKSRKITAKIPAETAHFDSALKSAVW
jgi:hypothetical protein